MGESSTSGPRDARRHLQVHGAGGGGGQPMASDQISRRSGPGLPDAMQLTASLMTNGGDGGGLGGGREHGRGRTEERGRGLGGGRQTVGLVRGSGYDAGAPCGAPSEGRGGDRPLRTPEETTLRTPFGEAPRSIGLCAARLCGGPGQRPGAVEVGLQLRPNVKQIAGGRFALTYGPVRHPHTEAHGANVTHQMLCTGRGCSSTQNKTLFSDIARGPFGERKTDTQTDLRPFAPLPPTDSICRMDTS